MTGVQSKISPLKRARRALQLVGIIALALSIMACGGLGSNPTSEVIEQAVVRQFETTQQALQQQLAPAAAASNLKISNIKTRRVQRVMLQDRPAYRVEGTYTLTGKVLSRAVRQARNPFEIYLHQDGEQTWVLVQPDAGLGAPQ